MCRQRNFSSSGFSKVSSCICHQSSRGNELEIRSGYESANWMGTLMSGTPNCAFTAPSENCTALCMMLCGCTTTCICSGATSNSHLASMISKPLFIILAESMVILAPMSQLGCLSAMAGVTVDSCSLLKVRKGPPLAVRIIFSTGLVSPMRLWKMALCSLSTGRMGALSLRHRSVTSSPATTSVSLLARAMALCALMALMVGRSPLNPTSAVSTMSMGSICTTWHRASLPVYTCMGSCSKASRTCSYLLSSAMTTAAG